MRKVYTDLVWRKVREGKPGWVFSLARQAFRCWAGGRLGRPLAGPLLGTLVTNYSCNLRCSLCPMPALDRDQEGTQPPELSTGEMLEVIDGFAALGTRGIGFTGGEPLLRRDLFQLLARSRERGMLTHLNTNGTLLTGERVQALLSSGADSLNISLDGATPATHDRRRGVKGSFDRAVGAVRGVLAERKKAGSPLRVKVVAVLAEDNLGEVGPYLDLAAGLGVDCVEFIPRQPFPAGPGGREPAGPETMEKVEKAVARLRGPLPVPLENSPGMLSLFLPSFAGAPSPLRCFAGFNSLAVDCRGRVFPCVPWVNWGRSRGDVRRAPLGELWRSPAWAEVRRETGRCRACTLNCQAELNLPFQPFRRLG